MKLSIKKYINETIRREAKIGHDKEVKCWYGILDHKVSLMLSQAKTKNAVRQELAEIFEDFIILSLKEGKRDKYNWIKSYKAQAAYR